VRIDPYERAWLVLGLLVLVAFLVGVVASITVFGYHLPGPAGYVNPRRLAQTPPFDQPGLRQIAPGKYEVVLVAMTWAFRPNEVRVPAGSEVTFVLSSQDVIHGFRIPNTPVNLMIIPGQITRTAVRFNRPGEYPFYCHEYCGIGHQVMSGRIIVESATAAR